MLKLSVRTPMLIGFAWFVISFTISELSYRAADLAYELGFEPPEILYDFSEYIAWPASILYLKKQKELNKNSLINLRMELVSSGEDTETVDHYITALKSSSDEEFEDIIEYLENAGHDAYLSTIDAYYVYGTASLLSGVLVTLCMFCSI